MQERCFLTADAMATFYSIGALLIRLSAAMIPASSGQATALMASAAWACLAADKTFPSARRQVQLRTSNWPRSMRGDWKSWLSGPSRTSHLRCAVRVEPALSACLMLEPAAPPHTHMQIKLDPAFAGKVRRVVVMGACESANGNSGCASEFNFRADPEAASVVLDAFGADGEPKIVLVPWECTMRSSLDWDFFDTLVPPANGSDKGIFLQGTVARVTAKVKNNVCMSGDGCRDPSVGMPACMHIHVDAHPQRNGCVQAFARRCRNTAGVQRLRRARTRGGGGLAFYLVMPMLHVCSRSPRLLLGPVICFVELNLVGRWRGVSPTLTGTANSRTGRCV